MLAPPKPPPHEEPEALMEEARERQRRRRLAGAAAVAIAAGIALGAYAVAAGFHHSRPARGPLDAGGAPLCRTAQLGSVPLGFGMAPGDVGGLSITNKSGLSCSLSHAPRVAVYLGSERLAVSQLPANAAVPDWREPAVHVLAPGKRAAVVFHWSNWCGSPSPGGRVTLRYFFGGGLVLSQTAGEPTCAAPDTPSVLRVAGPLA